MPQTGQRISGYAENVVASNTVTATGSTAAIANLSTVRFLVIQYRITAITGTTPSITFSLQDTVDGGTTWNTVQAESAMTAAGVTVRRIPDQTPFSDQVRFAYTVSGTTPSITFRIDWFTDVGPTLPMLE